MARKRRGPRAIRLSLEKTGDVSVYTSARLADALEEIRNKATLYEGVRLTQLFEAVYAQGKKDGARAAFERLDEIKREIPHQNPGRPRTRRSARR